MNNGGVSLRDSKSVGHTHTDYSLDPARVGLLINTGPELGRKRKDLLTGKERTGLCMRTGKPPGFALSVTRVPGSARSAML